MIDAMEVVETMCERYQTAVSSNDSQAYRKLFAGDAIRVPPGSEPEHGPDEIGQSEQKDYDVATWTVWSRALDALRIDDDWVWEFRRRFENTPEGRRQAEAHRREWLKENTVTTYGF